MNSAARGSPGSPKFDAIKLAANRGVLEGELDGAMLPRLAERLAAGRAPIRWRIVGNVDDQGRPELTLDLGGTVPLVCQRCLQPLAWPIAQQTTVLLARDETELARLDADEPEVVLAGRSLDAAQLVEDELLLSLPYAPRHEDDACTAHVQAGPAAQNKPVAMAKLAALKRNID